MRAALKAGLEESKAAQKILEEREQEACSPQSSASDQRLSPADWTRSALAKSKSKAFEARLAWAVSLPSWVTGPGCARRGPACPHSPAGGRLLFGSRGARALAPFATAGGRGRSFAEDERDKAKAEMQLAKRGCQEAEEAPRSEAAKRRCARMAQAWKPAAYMPDVRNLQAADEAGAHRLLGYAVPAPNRRMTLFALSETAQVPRGHDQGRLEFPQHPVQREGGAVFESHSMLSSRRMISLRSDVAGYRHPRPPESSDLVDTRDRRGSCKPGQSCTSRTLITG